MKERKFWTNYRLEETTTRFFVSVFQMNSQFPKGVNLGEIEISNFTNFLYMLLLLLKYNVENK